MDDERGDTTEEFEMTVAGGEREKSEVELGFLT